MPETHRSTIISAAGLTKEFRDFWGRPNSRAVNDIDFEIREGEVVGLLGPNGSGKSTTVKMLLGLLYPTGGRLTVFGKSPRDVVTKKLIGYLPEETYLYKYLTAYETLDFFGSLFGLSGIERRKRSEQLLEMVGLSHAAHRPVGEFSKGMARRIGLAQAMINDPALLILDEPTSGLDPIGCREVKDLIMLLKKRGKTVVVTSHLLSDVEDVCDRVIILYGGRLRAEGSISELLTIEKKTTVTTPELNPAETERLLKLLREDFSENDIRIDHPRMTLEDFFLDVVAKAKSESVETYGAHSGGGIADYLKDGDSESSQRNLLASLSSQEETPVAQGADSASDTASSASSVSGQGAAAVKSVLLDELSSDADTEKTKRNADALELLEKSREELSEANDRLKSLLGDKDDTEKKQK